MVLDAETKASRVAVFLVRSLRGAVSVSMVFNVVRTVSTSQMVVYFGFDGLIFRMALRSSFTFGSVPVDSLSYLLWKVDMADLATPMVEAA